MDSCSARRGRREEESGSPRSQAAPGEEGCRPARGRAGTAHSASGVSPTEGAGGARPHAPRHSLCFGDHLCQSRRDAVGRSTRLQQEGASSGAGLFHSLNPERSLRLLGRDGPVRTSWVTATGLPSAAWDRLAAALSPGPVLSHRHSRGPPRREATAPPYSGDTGDT